MNALRLLMTASACGAAVAALTLPALDARACGCFAPPDPSVPVVQAGERIVFSHENGIVTAHIQIQYEGEASEFGWLLPLPSDLIGGEPGLGVEEMFAQLINQTQPKYRLVRQPDDSCTFDFAVPASAGGRDGFENGGPDDDDVLINQGSIGAFDWALVSAASAAPMFEWLDENGFIIPDGTQDVVGPYVGDPKATFLALKLRKGNDVGDIQPIVVKYESDLPMIPIVLTSVAANPDMAIQVWVLGDSRAIPRNYRHTVLNEEYIDWFTAGSNYNEVIINATNEAPDGQSFVTEYAGPTAIMDDLIDWPGRFGERAAFESETDAGRYVSMLRSNGFVWSSGLLSLLRRTFPMPQSLLEVGITEDDYYQSIDYYLNFFREERPELFEGVDLTFDPLVLTADLWERIVAPTLEAGRLFDAYPKMTRLYTTLSPEEMTRDPVFSFNPSLPDVSNVHEATFVFDCEDTNKGVLYLPDGRRFFVDRPTDWIERDRTNIPYSRRIESLLEEGPPTVVVDNTTRISPSDGDAGGCGCSASGNPSGGAAWVAALVLAGFIWRRRR